MPDCERETEINAPVDKVLAYVSDPANLRRFVPGVRDADRVFNGGVEILAGPGDRRVEADMRPDADRHRVSWSVEGPADYRGSLNVLPADRGSLIRATIHSEHHSEEELRSAMDDVLQRLTQVLELES